MASTYVNNLRLEEMATGEQSGTWGTKTNTNLELIGQAVAWGTRAIANASTDNITIADGAADADRCLGLKLTGGGQACTVTLLPNTSSKTWVMYNATSYTLTFTCGSGANVAILAGETKMIATDGLGSGGVVHDLLTAVNLAGTTKTAALTNAGALSNQGTVTVGLDDTGYDVKFFGATSGSHMLWDESADSLRLTDNTSLTFGDSGSDLTITHDGSNSFITEGGTGALYIQGTSGVFIRSGDGGENLAGFTDDGAATLYHNNVARIATTATGTFSTGDNFTFYDTSTDAAFGPYLDLSRDSASPADNDGMGIVRFLGDNSAGEATHYASIHAINLDVTDGTEDGALQIDAILAGTVRSRALFNSTETIFNQDAQDLDFRVESSGNANCLFVAAGENRVGILTASPTRPLVVASGAAMKLATSHGALFNDTANDGGVIIGSDFAIGSIQATNAAGTSAKDLMLQKEGGKVSVGTSSSPTDNLQVTGTGLQALGVQSTSTGAAILELLAAGSSEAICYGASNAGLRFATISGLGAAGFSEKMRLLADGKFGVGTAAPRGVFQVQQSTNVNLMINTVTSGNITINAINDANSANVPLEFRSSQTNFTAGSVCINDTANANSVRLNVKGNGSQHVIEVDLNSTNALYGMFFVNPNGTVGNITVSGSTTAYNTSSDYRLKENVSYSFDATTRLKKLKPARFNFIADADSTVDGFLAHEVAEVVPEAITGTKDEVEVWTSDEVDNDKAPDGVAAGDNKLDDDGNTIPIMQGIDQAKLVPLLVKTILELEARITALEG